MPTVQLTYYMWSERLIGKIGDQDFNMRAVSGGGRGSKDPASEETSFKSFSPYTQTIKDKQKGGSIPPGIWLVQKPSTYKNKNSKKKYPVSPLMPIDIDEPFADLAPKEKTPYGRDYTGAPFLIHGPGGEGSEGCIIIDKEPRTLLLEAVEKSDEPVYLRVSPWDLDQKIHPPIVTRIRTA